MKCFDLYALARLLQKEISNDRLNADVIHISKFLIFFYPQHETYYHQKLNLNTRVQYSDIETRCNNNRVNEYTFHGTNTLIHAKNRKRMEERYASYIQKREWVGSTQSRQEGK